MPEILVGKKKLQSLLSLQGLQPISAHFSPQPTRDTHVEIWCCVLGCRSVSAFNEVRARSSWSSQQRFASSRPSWQKSNWLGERECVGLQHSYVMRESCFGVCVYAVPCQHHERCSVLILLLLSAADFPTQVVYGAVHSSRGIKWSGIWNAGESVGAHFTRGKKLSNSCNEVERCETLMISRILMETCPKHARTSRGFSERMQSRVYTYKSQIYVYINYIYIFVLYTHMHFKCHSLGFISNDIPPWRHHVWLLHLRESQPSRGHVSDSTTTLGGYCKILENQRPERSFSDISFACSLSRCFQHPSSRVEHEAAAKVAPAPSGAAAGGRQGQTGKRRSVKAAAFEERTLCSVSCSWAKDPEGQLKWEDSVSNMSSWDRNRCVEWPRASLFYNEPWNSYLVHVIFWKPLTRKSLQKPLSFAPKEPPQTDSKDGPGPAAVLPSAKDPVQVCRFLLCDGSKKRMLGISNDIEYHRMGIRE